MATATITFDGGENILWNKVSWAVDTPTGATFVIKARVADTEAGLADASWNLFGDGSPDYMPLQGRWLEVLCTFTATIDTPTLSSLCITYAPNTKWTAE